MPRVSVIMPVYNGVRFVAKSIESVLAQDYQDWELIIIDDGSTDETAEILAGFTDVRIHIIHQPNRGEAVARNRGLDAVRGEYVAFLDADDLYLPNALADMVAYLAVHLETDAVCSDGYFCDENDRLLGRMSEVRPQVQPGNILEKLVIDPTVVGPPIFIMIRIACILKARARFDPHLVIGPDWDFWIQLAHHARFGYLDRPTCMYRIHQTNITLTSGPERRKADLVRGRLKVLHSTWFDELPASTRSKFFYQLLVDLLAKSVDQQREILATPAFHRLALNQRADLLRVIAGQYLRQGDEHEFALKCLREAVRLDPGSRRNRLLLELTRASVPAAVALLHSRSLIDKARWRIRRLRRQVPRSVPSGLMPFDR